MKALKKILLVLIVGALIAGAFIPMGSVAQLSTAPAIQVDLVWMNGPTNVTGEYANETHYVLVKVTNTGTEYLSDIDVTCEIYSDDQAQFMVTDLGLNETASLDIGETMVFEFWDWTPNVADPMVDNYFWINATAMGMGFMDVTASDNVLQPVTIRNVTNVDWVHNMMFDTMGVIMTPYPYVEEMMPGVETYNYSSAANQPQYNLINLGNVPATVTVDIAGYDLGSGTPDVAVHTDSDTPTIGPGMTTDWTDFPSGTWDLSALAGDGLINVSVSGADWVAANTTHEFMVADYTDVKPMLLVSDLVVMYGTTTFNTTAEHTFMVMVVNSGNQDITSDFYVNLTSAVWTPLTIGTPTEYGYQLIDAGTTTLSPGDASMEMWTPIAPPGTGLYSFNATAPMVHSLTEQNITNNETSIILTFQDTEGLDLEITSPMTGKYPVMGIDVNATVTNTGTLDFADLGGCNVSLEIFDTNMTIDTGDDVSVWAPADVVIAGLPMTMDMWADWLWTGAEGGMEYRIVVNASAGTNFLIKEETIKFPHPNGTVSGTITPNMAGIEVAAYDGTTMITSTTTDASGYYTMSLEAILNAYNITVTAPYGYMDAWNDTVMIMDDGRTTFANFDLIPYDTGTVNGTITLMEEGMPDPNLDYTDITVAVDGTLLSVSANDVGNYSITGVMPGTVNVTASMTGYTTAWNDTVDVVALMTTMYVNLTLYEDWNVMVDPAHGDTDVAVDTTVTVTFEEDINKTTVNLTNSFDVMDSSDTSVPGTIAWTDNMTFVFTPDANLTQGETYTVWIEDSVMSAMDMAVLHRDWYSEFTVIVMVPPDGTIEGYVTDELTGAAIEGATVTSGTVSGMTDADGMYSIDVPAGTGLGVTATKYKYEDATLTGIDVVAAMTTGDHNITMTPIIDIEVWVWVGGIETEIDPDTDALPDVDLDTVVIMKFSEALNESTLAFTLDSVTGTTDWNATGMTATFTPDENLTESTEYVVTISTDVTNVTDDAILPRDVEWKFMTYTPPTYWTVTASGPTGTGILTDASVTATFSEAMNTTDVQGKFSISPAVTGGSFTWAGGNTSFTWTHTTAFTTDTPYTVTISKDAKSAAGNNAEEDATWTFTTEAGEITESSPVTIGPINDKDGNPLAGATVTLTDPDDKDYSGTTGTDGTVTFDFTEVLPSGTYDVKVTAKDYEDKTWSISYDNVTDTWSGTGTDGTGVQLTEKEDKDEEFDWLPVILIIVVIIIIVILLALAMKPKKAAEEELEEEEGEEEEGMEEEEFECPECGAAVSSGEAVCPECGAEFEEEEFECPECGAQIEPGAGTCPECGAEFEAEEEEMEEGEEGEEMEEELEDYEIEEDEEFEEEEMGEGEEMEEEEMEEAEEMEEGEVEELPEEEDEFSEEEAEEASEEEEEELD